MATGPRYRLRAYCAAGLVCLAASGLSAQQSSIASVAQTPVPRVVWFSGSFRPADRLPIAPVESVTFAVYHDQDGGSALWQETQNVVVNADGSYNVLLGSMTAEGLPLDLFATGEPRWLGVQFNRSGETEQPRVQLTSVPYALKAADANTLGGRPASAYVLAPTAVAGDGHAAGTASASITPQSPPPTTQALLPGTTNFLAKYVSSADVGNSAVYESGGTVGLGTTTPLDLFHVRFKNTDGGLTGYAVQNLGNTTTSYSGMLFYDQNGALGQFQGFNNSTHEYRINNIAQNAGVFNGSINFMIGSTSRLFVNANGDVGIGTAAPDATLRVVGPSSETALYATSPGGGRHAIRADDTNGSVALLAVNAAPGSVLDFLSNSAIVGYGATAATGVIGSSETGDGIVGESSSGLAGHFFGNVTITGTLAKGGGSFKIDHPLDPANKYLSHSFVESPDMMNIYNGNVTLDAKGEAIVMLPGWFDALNRDFRYQLTALGAPGPNLYIAEEIANGRFKIGGGAGSGRVSWQVTGVRHDAFAEAHRIAVEEDKPATERGHYLYPELYGQPADTRIGPGTTVKKKDQ